MIWINHKLMIFSMKKKVGAKAFFQKCLFKMWAAESCHLCKLLISIAIKQCSLTAACHAGNSSCVGGHLGNGASAGSETFKLLVRPGHGHQHGQGWSPAYLWSSKLVPFVSCPLPAPRSYLSSAIRKLLGDWYNLISLFGLQVNI